MKNKGFTLIELLTTFVLASVIIIVLLSIVNNIRKIYNNTDTKTELYIIQGNVSNALNKKINKDNVSSYTTCNDSDFCYIFSLVNNEEIKVSTTASSIKVGDLTYNLPKGAKVVDPSLTTTFIEESDASKNNSILIMRIPIKSTLHPDLNYGINLVYPYNSNKTPL